jgi:hypothetical protein
VLNIEVSVRFYSLDLSKFSFHRVTPDPIDKVFRPRVDDILMAKINPGVQNGNPNPLIALLVLEPPIYSCVQVLECLVRDLFPGNS